MFVTDWLTLPPRRNKKVSKPVSQKVNIRSMLRWRWFCATSEQCFRGGICNISFVRREDPWWMRCLTWQNAPVQFTCSSNSLVQRSRFSRIPLFGQWHSESSFYFRDSYLGFRLNSLFVTDTVQNYGRCERNFETWIKQHSVKTLSNPWNSLKS